MKKKLASSFVQLTLDACLKSFWRKQALRLFLKQHGIADSKLSILAGEVTKRDFLHDLFHSLITVENNKGHEVILKMARSLSSMTYFPDLEHWEDSTQKKSTAKESVERLKRELAKLDQQVVDFRKRELSRKKAQERQKALIEFHESLDKLSDRLNEMVSKQGTQEGGYDFEKWFYDLLGYFEIDARPPYKSDGRQIDGSLTLDGTTFLIETKFTNEQTGAPDIDTFMTKITRKADNTMGIFISMSGYSSVAIGEASRDRTPMLLMDFSHIYNLVLSGVLPLQDVIRRIKRHASQTGKSFLPVDRFSG